MYVTIRFKKEYFDTVLQLLADSDALYELYGDCPEYDKMCDKLGDNANDLGWLVINKMCPKKVTRPRTQQAKRALKAGAKAFKKQL